MKIFTLGKLFPKLRKEKEKGITLAETLVAIAVLGIIAVVIVGFALPVFQDKLRTQQVAVAKRKFQKAQELMVVNGEIGPYYSSTHEFVKALSKYISLNKICRVGTEPSELPSVTNCFGDNYDTVTLADGTTMSLTDIATGSAFNMTEDDDNDWTSPNIAAISVDGTRLILSYNTKCTALVPGVYSGDTTTRCVAGILDVDGDKLPNTLEKDVALLGEAETLGDDGEAARIAAAEEAARIAAEEEAARLAAEEAARIAAEEEAARLAAEQAAAEEAARLAAEAAAAQQAHDDAVALGESYCSRMSMALISSCTCSVSDTNETRCTTKFSQSAGGSVYTNCLIYTNAKGAAVMDMNDCK